MFQSLPYTKGVRPIPVAQRFWCFVKKTRTCWLWCGRVDKNTGYGVISSPNSRSSLGAHVASWLLRKGDVPKGLFVLHTCDVRRCVRHLYVGNHQENMDDMWRRGRANTKNRLFGEEHPNRKLLEKDVREIVACVRKHGRVYGLQTHLAKRFGVGMTAVANVLNGWTWCHLTGGRVT